ncbi:hypothetical protein DXG01_003723 [Tephrocybe rancida]|nr:hypothetical protein DXG01_003723 [Tephrocybe rancida]
MTLSTSVASTSGVAGLDLDEFEEELQFIEGRTATLSKEDASSLMGSVTIDSIMASLPKGTKLLHAELVLQPELQRKYLAMRRRIQRIAEQRVKDRHRRDVSTADAKALESGGETVVFHGTMTDNIHSIVESGFEKPWDMVPYDEEYPVYGTRILPWGRIVCAALMGRTYQLMLKEYGTVPGLTPGYDSHTSSNCHDYVVFHSAQILPLYVLHLGSAPGDTLGHVDWPHYGQILFNPRLASPAETVAKWLPFGFGNRTGKGLIVEAVADVDEDEEWMRYSHVDADPLGDFQDSRFGYAWILGYNSASDDL